MAYGIQDFAMSKFSVRVGTENFLPFLKICEMCGLRWNGEPDRDAAKTHIEPFHEDETIFCGWFQARPKVILHGNATTHWPWGGDRPVINYEQLIADNPHLLKLIEKYDRKQIWELEAELADACAAV